jgi:hypothetical protein
VARIRTIKPEFFYSEQVAQLPHAARLLFIGLWTLADREGRMDWSGRKVKAQLFPYDDGLEIHPLAEALAEAGLVQFYQVGGSFYLQLPTFAKHQRPHPKEPASALPSCPEDTEAGWLPWKKTASNVLPGSIPSSPVGREGKGMEGNGRSLGSSERPKPLIVGPLAFEKIHGQHVSAFCSFVCLPRQLWDGWVNRVMSSGLSEEASIGQVQAFADGVRKRYQDSGQVPGGDDFSFWRAEWTAAHPTVKPAKVAAGDTHADRLAAIERYRRPS